MPAGQGTKIVENAKKQFKNQEDRKNLLMIAVIGLIMAIGFITNQFLTSIIAVGIVFFIFYQIKPKNKQCREKSCPIY